MRNSGGKAYVEVRGKLAFIRLEPKGQAVVPLEKLCEIAKRFRLELVGYECKQTAGSKERANC